jgi:uncharacterized protein involved in exopolysaccharide biosynthesis
MSRYFESLQAAGSYEIKNVRSEISTAVLDVRPQMSARAAVEAFCRHGKLFSLSVLAVLLVTLVATFAAHKEYVSQMKFIVQNARENVVVTPQRTTAANAATDVTEEQVNSELEILHSHDVIDQVADPGWALIPASQRTQSAERGHEKNLTSFEKRLTTAIVRKTNVINVSLGADTPEHAQSQLQQLVSAYLAEHRRLQRPAGAAAFFASEAERTRKAWNDATAQLVQFQQQHRVLSVADTASFLDDQIHETENELFDTNANLSETDAQVSDLSRRLNQMPARQVTQEKLTPNQLSSEQLDTLAVELQNKRIALAANYKPTDRLLQQLDEQIAAVKSALNEAKTVPTHEQTTDVDPAWQQLRTSYIQNQITREALDQRKMSLNSHLNTLRQSLDDLQNATTQFNNLQTQANELKENYELYLQKRDQAQIEDAMDEHKLLNVAVAQEATLSFVPVHPRPKLNLALGAFTAIFVGLCIVYFAETGRRTVSSPRELESVSRYPVLATVPRASLPVLPTAHELENAQETVPA